jgi:hypothetical protein
MWHRQPPQFATVTLPAADWLAGYAATAVEFGGFGVGVTQWRRLARGQRLIAVWLGTSALADLAEYIIAPISNNVQPIANLWFAASVILAVEALAAYQNSRQRAALLRTAIGLYLLLWVILVATIDPLNRYSSYVGPVHGLVILCAAVITIFRRVSLGRRDLSSDPGFLVAAALSVYAILAAFQTLVAQALLNLHRQQAIMFYAMCSVVGALGVLVIIRALMVPGIRSMEQRA